MTLRNFQTYSSMIAITDGLSLSQICTITRLETSTIQNWVKRGFVPHPINKKYYDRHLSRILMIDALRSCIMIEEIGELLRLINGDTDDEKDDIISEPLLYDYFVNIVNQLNDINPKEIEKLINKELEGYEENNKKKLRLALNIMTNSYLVSILKNKVSQDMKEIRND